MRVYIDLTWVRTKYGGFNHYAKQIINNYSSDHEVKYILEKKYEHLFEKIEESKKVIIHTQKNNSRFSSLINFTYRLIELYKLQKKLDAPFLFPAWPGHIFAKNKILFVKHDICRITSPQLFDNKIYKWDYWLWTVYSTFYTRYCDTLATVSNSEKKEIRDRLNFNKNKIHVTFNYVEKKPLGELQLRRNRILFTGILVKRKNPKVVIDIAKYIKNKNLNFEIIMIGGKTAYWESIYSNEKYDCLKVYHNINDDEKNSLIKNAYFLYPSCCEGFGIPVLEAVNYLCPVICNPLPVMKEILGDAGIYMDFTSNNFPENLFRKIKALDKVFFENYKLKRETILKKFSKINFCKQFDKFIEK